MHVIRSVVRVWVGRVSPVHAFTGRGSESLGSPSAAPYLLPMSAFTIRMPFTNPGPIRHSALVDDPCHLRPRSISFSFRSAMLARHPCCQNSSGKGDGGNHAVHQWRASVSRGGRKNDRRCVHAVTERARWCASKRAPDGSTRGCAFPIYKGHGDVSCGRAISRTP